MFVASLLLMGEGRFLRFLTIFIGPGMESSSGTRVTFRISDVSGNSSAEVYGKFRHDIGRNLV